jgi:hypothetical protein
MHLGDPDENRIRAVQRTLTQPGKVSLHSSSSTTKLWLLHHFVSDLELVFCAVQTITRPCAKADLHLSLPAEAI